MERNITLDYFKIILCFLVVAAHLHPLAAKDSFLSWFTINGIARITVPCFYIINGFYLYSKVSSSKSIAKYMKHLLIVYATWTAIYLVRFPLYEWDIQITSLIFGTYHLWYVAALIGAVIVLFYIKKVIKNNHIILLLSLILFATGLYLQDNYFPFSSEALRTNIFRNFLFFAFPFVFLGYYIKENINKILKIKSTILFVSVLIGFVILFFESSHAYDFIAKRELFYSTAIICPLLFILVLKHSKFTINDGYIGLLSSVLYYVHILVINMADILYPISEYRIYLLPFVLFLSLILSVIIIEMNKRIKIFL